MPTCPPLPCVSSRWKCGCLPILLTMALTHPPPPSPLQELAEERERVAHAKELEVARLRAMQEKIIDNRSALVSLCGAG